MVGTIDLYSLALTPNDTMYFDSVNAQTQWFNERQHLTIDNVSFNGARAFQLGNNYLDIIFQYNYVRYQLNGRYIYAFIENVDYTNDNCCSLQLSIDLNQTFLTELQTVISTSNIGNVTKKDSYFSTYKSYDNKLSVSEYNVQHLGRLNDYTDGTLLVGFVLVNIDDKTELTQNVNGAHTIVVGRTIDNNYYLPCGTLVFPIKYNLTTRKFIKTDAFMHNGIYMKDQNNNGISVDGAEYLNEFIKYYGSYISNIGLTFESIAGLTYVEENNDYYFSYHTDNIRVIENVVRPEETTITIGDIIHIKRNSEKQVKTFNLTTLNNYPLPLLRQPYVYIRVGNDYEYITLNLLDFFDNTAITTPLQLKVEYFTSCFYPYVTNLVFYLNNKPIIDRNMVFNLTVSDPIPYKIDAWESYYAQNKASVNDGLKTAQNYERKQQAIQITGQLVNAGIDYTVGKIPFTKAGNLYKRPHASTDRSVISGGANILETIINAGVNWANGELERSKQRALLDISWNDIKSSPSDFSNMNSSITSRYNSGPQCIEIDIYIANNIDDIARYHKQYGYKVNRMETLAWADIKQHTVFDYISFNTITLKSTLPQFYTAMIEQHYEQGVRFWYDYNNFMNFEIENGEIA